MKIEHIAIWASNIEKLREFYVKYFGLNILDGPRATGDGYYESIVLDPENNRIEITV